MSCEDVVSTPLLAYRKGIVECHPSMPPEAVAKPCSYVSTRLCTTRNTRHAMDEKWYFCSTHMFARV